MWQCQSGFAEMFIEFCARHSLGDYRESLLEILTIYENYMEKIKEESRDCENLKSDEADEEFNFTHTSAEVIDTKEEVTDVDEAAAWMKEPANVMEAMSVTSSDSKNTPLLPGVDSSVASETYPSILAYDASQPICLSSFSPIPTDDASASLWHSDISQALLQNPVRPEPSHEIMAEGNRPSSICPVCGKVFRSASYVKFHLRMHSGDSQHECRVCRRRFPFRSNLIRHELAHSGTRSFICPVCQRTFILKHHLTAHIRRHHSTPTLTDSPSLPSPV